jgi:hypothetical protein
MISFSRSSVLNQLFALYEREDTATMHHRFNELNRQIRMAVLVPICAQVPSATAPWVRSTERGLACVSARAVPADFNSPQPPEHRFTQQNCR